MGFVDRGKMLGELLNKGNENLKAEGQHFPEQLILNYSRGP